MSEPLAVGAKAPAFAAEASDGRTYKLADLLQAGHVALIFYPGNTANSPPCAMRWPSSSRRASSPWV